MGVIRFKGNILDPASINALVSGTLVEGHATAKWWRLQSADFLNKFTAEIKIAMQNGESITQALTRITGGTVSGVTVPGIMKTTKAKAGAMVSTAINRVSNEAALQSFQLNSDVIKQIQQVSTLDNKTSDICIAYSGKVWDILTLAPVATPTSEGTLPFNGGPPRHFNCRSRLRPVTKSFDELGIPGLSDEIPASTRASMDGQVAADITFDAWLRKKGLEFQRKLLGAKRAELYRAGKINLTQLVDMRGNPLSLTQLEQRIGIKPTVPKPKPTLVESFIDDVLITEAERKELETLGNRAFTKAAKADPIVTDQIVKIADDVKATFPKAAAPGAPPGAEEVVDGSLTYFRLKSAESSARKIQTYAAKFEITNLEAAERLSDSIRYTFVISEENYVAGIKRTMEEFSRLGYKNGKFDPTWFTRPDYRGVNINMITPQGVKMELQFHTPASFNTKQNINHALYEKFRTLPKARQLGGEGQALQRQMIANAEAVPIPKNIQLMDELTKLYDRPNAAAQKKLLRDATKKQSEHLATKREAAKKVKKEAAEKLATEKRLTKERAAREKKALADQKKIEDEIAAAKKKEEMTENDAVKSALQGKFEKLGETQDVIDMHIDAFAKAPSYMKSAIGQRKPLAQLVTEYDLARNNGAFYKHYRNEIWINAKSHPNRFGRNATWRHEYGHAIDYELAERYYRLTGTVPQKDKWGIPLISARFNKSLLVDSRRFQKWKSTAENSQKYDQRVVKLQTESFEVGREKYFNPLLKKHGMTYDQIHAMAKNNFNLPLGHRLDSYVDDFFIPNMLASIETGNMQSFLSAATQHLWEGGGDLASMSDYVGSITRNKIRGNWGHNNSYYTARHGKTGKHKEAFANFFGMLGGEDAAFFESLLRAWKTDKFLDDLIKAMKLLEKG